MYTVQPEKDLEAMFAMYRIREEVGNGAMQPFFSPIGLGMPGNLYGNPTSQSYSPNNYMSMMQGGKSGNSSISKSGSPGILNGYSNSSASLAGRGYSSISISPGGSTYVTIVGNYGTVNNVTVSGGAGKSGK